MVAPIIVTKGQVFGRLVVIKELEAVFSSRQRKRRFKCKCQCGTKVEVWLQSLRSGNSRSCGCYHTDVRTKNPTPIERGFSRSNLRLYQCYINMMERCYNTNHKSYDNYGGRGIRVCRKWRHDRNTFFRWAKKHGYEDHLEIDRENNEKNYTPKNCRWVTRKVNARNTRVNRVVKYKGEKMALIEAVERFAHPSLTYSRVQKRLNAGWSVKKSLRKSWIG